MIINVSVCTCGCALFNNTTVSITREYYTKKLILSIFQAPAVAKTLQPAKNANLFAENAKKEKKRYNQAEPMSIPNYERINGECWN